LTESLFDRAKALNQKTWAEGKPILETVARLNELFAKSVYAPADKTAIVKTLAKLGLLKKDDGGKFALLRQNHGKLLKRKTNGQVEVVANGRGDWIGWVELKTEEVDEIATRNTAQVVRDKQLLPAVGAVPYAHVMVIDGNDDRGIDVGLVSRLPIATMRSHVDDLVAGTLVFSRDCPEYEIKLPAGGSLVILANHLKSKGFGSQADSNARRLKQAKRESRKVRR
jgi:hypothetical protein